MDISITYLTSFTTSTCTIMGRIEWAMWANEQAIAASIITLMGGIIGISHMQLFEFPPISAIAIGAGLLSFLFEYPRSARRNGKTVERQYQQYLTKVLSSCGLIATNYYLRFVLYLILAIPLCATLPTITGGLCYLGVSATYFVAALKNESWRPVAAQQVTTRTPAINQPPSVPPPRPPQAVNAHRNEPINMRQLNGSNAV